MSRIKDAIHYSAGCAGGCFAGYGASRYADYVADFFRNAPSPFNYEALLWRMNPSFWTLISITLFGALGIAAVYRMKSRK